MENSQTLEELLKAHIFWAQDKDICDQCVRPWHDGICECGHFNDERIQRIKEVAYDLILSDNNLEQL